MKVKFGSTDEIEVKSGTYNGVYVNTLLKASAVNTALANSDYKPEQVAVKVELERDGDTKVILQNNLLILGLFNTITKGRHEFTNGIIKVPHGVAVKQVSQKSVFIDFGGALRIADNDVLRVQVTPNSSAITSNCDTQLSEVEAYLNPCIAYEEGIHQTHAKVITAATDSQPVNLGNNVTLVAFLNFDKTDYQNEVITNLTLSSDKLDLNLTGNRIIAMRPQQFAPNIPYVFNGAGRIFDLHPQTFLVFDGKKPDGQQVELDNARLDLQFNPDNVAASQNYVVWRTYSLTPQKAQETATRMAKHEAENIKKVVGGGTI